jgi:hypothetical protein
MSIHLLLAPPQAPARRISGWRASQHSYYYFTRPFLSLGLQPPTHLINHQCNHRLLPSTPSDYYL